MRKVRNTFEHTVEAVVTPSLVNKTREITLKQREVKSKKASDKFFEKTSDLGTVAIQLPLFLVKEFSLARINSYKNIILFGFAAFWAGTQIKLHLGDFWMSMIPVMLLVFSLYKIIQGAMILSMVLSDTNRIKLNTKENFKTIPMFIVKVYRTLIIKVVDINWSSFLFYLIGGLYIALPTWLNNYTIPYTYITFTFADIDNPWGVYSMVKYALIATVFLQVFYNVWVNNRINVINKFYGYEIIPNIEVLEIKKVRHARWRRLTIICVFILFFVFIAIYRFLRHEKILK